MQVKDIVYTVESGWPDNNLVIASWQIISINRRGVLRVYRKDKSLDGKFKHHLYPNGYSLSPEEAINKLITFLESKIDSLKEDLKKALTLANKVVE